MEIGFIGQPYRDSQCGSTFLADALEDTTITKLLVVTAWVRQSGLELIAPDLRALRKRRGKVEIFTGIDLKGTSVQGLELAQELGSNVRVVHDPAGRTFHPKIYLATGPQSGYALLGSNNLTAGGMSFNYEGAFGVSFRTAEKPDFVKGIESFVKRLVEDKEICKRLTPSVMKRLIADDWLADEVKDRRHRDEDRARRGAAKARSSQPLFGRSRFEKRLGPPPRRADPQSADRKPHKPSRGRTASRRAQPVGAPDSWWKKLGPGDAQRSPEGNLTHVVRLTPPRNVKNRARFFRHVFFKDEQWRARRDTLGNRLEVAKIKVHASIGDRDLGVREIEIDYGAYRNVRGRATTVLHWGDLMPEILEEDVTGHYLLIERGPDAYSLFLGTVEPA